MSDSSGEPIAKRKRRRRAARRPQRSAAPRRVVTRYRALPAFARRLVLLLAGFVLALALIASTLQLWARWPGSGEARHVRVLLPPGVTEGGVAAILHDAGLIRSPRLFAVYATVLGDARQIAAGAHLLDAGLSARELERRLERDPDRTKDRVTVPEGWNVFQISRRLEDAGVCAAPDFLAAARERALLDELGIRRKSVEGFLFPATYELSLDAEPHAVVRMLVDEMRARLRRVYALEPAGRRRLAARGWADEEILTLASVVEKESARPDDRRSIASVFMNRLDDPAFQPARALASDPTALYGCLVAPDYAPSCAEARGKLTPALLRDGDNAYNTYVHPGLPPGPIANPGQDAILAVLAPARTSYLFFVAGPNGKTTFSRSFDEHRAKIGTAP